MLKKILIPIVVVIVLIVGFVFLKKDKNSSLDQTVYEETLSVSRQYALLRYESENVLVKAKEYGDYDKWDQELTSIIEDWKNLEGDVAELEKNAEKLANEKTAFDLIKNTYAYDSVEVQKVIESAPMGKQIRTLAKHFGVDAKMAQLILNQSQDQATREAWGEAGDTFQSLENDAVRLKNGCKVTVYVGTVALSGGIAGVVSSGAIATAGTVVAGADLALEITEDEARIALGDKNKITEMAGSIRSVTEPASGILAIANIPGNLSKAVDKFVAVNFAADQVRSGIQDKKIIGISIKSDDKGEVKAEVSGLTADELPIWKKDNNVVETKETGEEVMKQIETEVEEEKITEVPTKEEEKKETVKTDSENTGIQTFKVVNVSGASYMMDSCFSSTCWDDLDADPTEDRDLGGIYTMGKVFGNGESFEKSFRTSDLKDTNRLDGGYKITAYFAIAPFEGPKNKTIDYGTWLNESVEIQAKYGDKPVIEWDGSSLKQVQ
ncbi:MAG: hypothetical protein PHX34_02450 [Candidatus Shapirobacteria bacterium]|nr:hypothetical protein [Candidatus Shapirobacteria bacterium]